MCLSFLLQLEDDFPEDEEDQHSAFKSGLQATARFSTILGAKLLLRPGLALADQCLAHAEWTKRCAGLSLLAYMAEGMGDKFKPCFAQVLPAVLRVLVADAHPRVQYHAATAVAQFSVRVTRVFFTRGNVCNPNQVDFEGYFQPTFAAQVLPSFCAVLQVCGRCRVVFTCFASAPASQAPTAGPE